MMGEGKLLGEGGLPEEVVGRGDGLWLSTVRGC